jgi:hypothetical protein
MESSLEEDENEEQLEVKKRNRKPPPRYVQSPSSATAKDTLESQQSAPTRLKNNKRTKLVEISACLSAHKIVPNVQQNKRPGKKIDTDVSKRVFRRERFVQSTSTILLQELCLPRPLKFRLHMHPLLFYHPMLTCWVLNKVDLNICNQVNLDVMSCNGFQALPYAPSDCSTATCVRSAYPQ